MNYEKILEDIDRRGKRIILERFRSIFEKEGLSGLADYWLQLFNAKPDYVLSRKNFDLFKGMRGRLSTESGVVISNHPGYLDTPIILKSLGNRTDIKIIMNDRLYDENKDILPSKYFIPAIQSFTGAKNFLEISKNHVESGGIVMIYPTGGIESFTTKHVPFKKGLYSLLNNVPKDTMVYAFNIDQSDIKSIIGKSAYEQNFQILGLTSQILAGFKPKRNYSQKNVRTYEAISTAQDWLEFSQHKSTKDLSGFYHRLFRMRNFRKPRRFRSR